MAVATDSRDAAISASIPSEPTAGRRDFASIRVCLLLMILTAERHEAAEFDPASWLFLLSGTSRVKFTLASMVGPFLMFRHQRIHAQMS